MCVIFLFSGCTKTNNKPCFFGSYIVSENISGVEFSITTDGTITDVEFRCPAILKGLTAKSNDGLEYSIEYEGISCNSTSSFIAIVRDFVSALDTLSICGKKQRNKYIAEIDGITVIAYTDNNKINKIEFNNRIFIINGDEKK